MSVSLIVAGTAAGYGAAAAAHLVGRSRTGRGLLKAAWFVNAGLVMLNWLVCGDPPMGSMYHVLTVLALCSVPALAFVERTPRPPGLAAVFALVAASAMAGALCVERDLLWRRMPALQSAWFVPHVFSYMAAYSLAAAAFGCLVAGLVRDRNADGAGWRAAGDEIVRLMFPFMTFGLVSGMLWADAAWGAYWSWDPKETWSLVTWLLYALTLQAARSSLQRASAFAHALGFAALVCTFLLVNMLPSLASPLHGYAAP